MSVYLDCEPPQLDCDIPPPDEDMSKRRDNENEFDIDELEFSSFANNQNIENITTNPLHLYSNSPPPVDDFFIRNNEDLDDLEIPKDDEKNDTKEIAIDDEKFDKIAAPPELNYTSSCEKSTIEDVVSTLKNLEDPIIKEVVVENKSDSEENSLENIDEKILKCDENITLEDDIPEETVTNDSNNIINDLHENMKKGSNESLDDLDFESFNDFENAIPIIKHVEKQIDDQTIEPSEVHFEADFSAFETNFDSEFNQPLNNEDVTEVKEASPLDLDDDDDFGDFNDFTIPASNEMTIINTSNENQQTLTVLDESEVKILLNEMFPTNQQVTDEKTASSDVCKENEINIVKDVESTLALNYDYKDSTTSHILIKALGIDVRNILFGAQWSSSSNMPRFASDLSFNPLEPSKFTSTSNASLKNTVVINSSKAKGKFENESDNLKEQQPDIVPEFDWNVAGLINPLDGKQTNALKPNESEETTLNYDLNVLDSTPHKGSDVSTSDLDNISSKHIWQSERFDVTNTVVRERTIKLPETHIFTPIKSVSPVAREVSRETSPSGRDKRTTVIKEYHDIEYSLEPTKKIESDDFSDFNDFQSASASTIASNNPGILIPTATISTMNSTILEPQKFMDRKKTTSTIADDFECILSSVPNQNTNVNSNYKYDPFAQLSDMPEKSVDDDFAEFQTAPTIVLQKQPQIAKSLYKEDAAITLSPSRLVNNLQDIPDTSSQQKFTSWMNDTLDCDEISRIEAAFPKCKPDNNKKKMQPQIGDAISIAKEDDEWCDFQSVSQPENNISSHTIISSQPSILNSSFDTKKLNSDIATDSSDWSDFVSVPIVKPSLNTSQFLPKPNFSSWNQSVSKPYVNHTTSFLSSNNNYSNNHFDESLCSNVSDNKKSKHPMNITNNYNYNFERKEVSTTTPPYQMPNGISTILPDLQFALPKTLVNLSRGGGSDSTKK